MITFNLGNDSPKKDKQQDIKIADLQAAVDELNTQIDAISITLGNLSASIDDKYAAQTQTLMNALTAQINSLSSALESALTTGQLTAQIANIERLMVTVSAGFVALEAETAKIESLEAEGIESDSVKADSAEIQTLSAEKAVFNEATITLLNMLALTVQSLTADTASIEEVTAEKISTEKIETDLLNAEHIAGGAWHTPISTPDNTELLHISIPRYNGMAQLQTEDNEFNVSILNNYLISYNQRGEYLYRIERKDESIDIYLQNVGDTVNYRVLFVGSETSGTVTSEIVDKTAYRQTITDFAGVLSLESVVLDVNILFCDYLPDEGEENNLYVVKTQGSYLWNENAREFIPLMGTNWQTKILSNESKIGDLTELSTEAKTDLVSAINEARESLLSRILMAESDIRDLQTDVASLDRDKLSKTGGEVTELRVDRNLVVGGDLIVEGTSIITDEETIETSSDYAVLRKNNPAGLGLHEKSGVVINNYDGNGKNASIGVDTDGIFRISDNTSESITTYTNISKFGAVYYEGFNQDTRQTVTKGAIVSEIVDELSECAFDSVTEDYYHYKGEWYRVDLDNNHHSFRYDESSPVTDTQLLDRLVALTKDNLFYYWSLSVMTVDDVTNQPILTRSEAAELVDGAPLLWDATHNKAVKIAAPTSTDQVLGANGRTGAVMWTDQIETVSTLPVSPDIQTRIYKCAGKYYIGDKTTQILQELNYAVDTVEKGNINPVTSNAVYDFTSMFSHNIPRYVNGVLGKDITAYYNDGTLWKRLNGTDGYSYLEDIYVGDYFQMSRAITCPNSHEGTIGSAWVTIAGINTLQGNGDTVDMMYNHLVMIPGKGEGGSFHFGRQAMNTTDTTEGGYKASQMRTSVLGPVVSAGSTASGATINQQLYAEFGSHLKTTRELITNTLNANGVNRFGSASGCSSNWEWSSEQAILMSEVEVYGSTVWSSSGHDTGNAKVQLPLFRYSTKALNNRSAWWWLKDVATAALFCRVTDNGGADYYVAGNAGVYVRPRFVLAA